MSNDFLAEFDALAHAAFADAGMADAAVLRQHAGSVPVDTACSVYIDREPATGDMGGTEFYTDRVAVRVLRAGLTGKPVRGDTFTVTNADASVEVFTIDQPLRSDESSWEFLCRL